MSKTIKISVCMTALVILLFTACGSAHADYGFSAGTKSDFGFGQTSNNGYGYVEARQNTDATNINASQVPESELRGNKDYYFCRYCNCMHHKSYNPNHYNQDQYCNSTRPAQVQNDLQYVRSQENGKTQTLHYMGKGR